jgi:putative membrane protein
MLKLLLRFAINAAAIGAAIEVLPGLDFDTQGAGLWTYLGFVLLLALLNAIVKPIVTILSLPCVICTLGLFLLVIGAGMFILLDELSGRFTIDDPRWGWALLTVIIYSVVSGVLESIFGLNKDKDKDKGKAKRDQEKPKHMGGWPDFG